MSLILDALKKSEQERRRDKGPDLQTIHQPAVIRAPQRSYRLLWIALLLAVNAAVLIAWWQQRSVAPVSATATPLVASQQAATSTPTPASAQAQTAAQAPPVVAPTNDASQPVAAGEQAAAHSDSANAEYTRITPTNSVAAAAPPVSARIEEVDELPEDVRNNLPAMTFSFHVYSSNPQQRTIIINNRRMREGEEVNAGLLLQQITEDGVILLYAQHRIHISVLSGW